MSELCHQHLLIRAEVNNPPRTPEEGKKLLADIVKAIDMVICPTGGPHAHYVTTKGNEGLASTVMLMTSHASCHTWDAIEPALMQADVYSCAKYDPQVVIDHFKQFDPVNIKFAMFDREHEFTETLRGEQRF